MVVSIPFRHRVLCVLLPDAAPEGLHEKVILGGSVGLDLGAGRPVGTVAAWIKIWGRERDTF